MAPILERRVWKDVPDTSELARELRSSGRICRAVNGRAVSVALLREIAELLVDVHGQSEHSGLLRVREHLSLLIVSPVWSRWRCVWPTPACAHANFAATSANCSVTSVVPRVRLRMDLLHFQVEWRSATRPSNPARRRPSRLSCCG